MSRAAASSSSAAASAAASASTLGYRSSSSSSSPAPPSKKQKQQADDSGSAPAAAAAAASSSRVPPSKEDEIQAACADLARAPDPLLLMLQLLLNDQDVRSDARSSNFPRELTQLVYDYATSTSLPKQIRYEVDNGDWLTGDVQLRAWIGKQWPRVADYNVLIDSNEDADAHRGNTCMTERECFGRWPGYRELLHAQLKPNEVRMCWKDLTAPGAPPALPTKTKAGENIITDRMMGEQVTSSLHAEFCETTLQARKAAIVARGEMPKLVGLHTLHRRIGAKLAAGKLPSRLSPHPAHWSLLFHIIAWSQHDANQATLRDFADEYEEWENDETNGWDPSDPYSEGEPPPEEPEPEPIMEAIRAKRQIECGGWAMTREEALWSSATPPTDGRLVVPEEAATTASQA